MSWSNYMYFQDDEFDEEDMDMSEERREARYKPRRLRHCYRNQLMLSEWLVDVSEDFADRWLMVKVPEGKRCLVVTGHGRTTSYLKSGRLALFVHENLHEFCTNMTIIFI